MNNDDNLGTQSMPVEKVCWQWIPRDGQLVKEPYPKDHCCQRLYMEYSPNFGMKDGFQNIKPDGSRCHKHENESRIIFE